MSTEFEVLTRRDGCQWVVWLPPHLKFRNSECWGTAQTEDEAIERMARSAATLKDWALRELARREAKGALSA